MSTAQPESRLWKIVNSSIVLWTLTAVVGSFVTFAFTNLQSCLKDADEKATRANRVYSEILNRRVDFLHAVNDAKSLTDLSARLKGLSYFWYEFKDVQCCRLLSK
jgi:hypothetical protein